jgi:UDP-N-acetylglucosamine 1-carboxyvinyltransferase
MAEKFIINGNRELAGEIEVRGSKNAAGPALAVALLTSEDCILDNLPLIEDIHITLEILTDLGAEVEYLSERKVRVKCQNINPEKMDFTKFSKTRISVLLLGPLFARFTHFKFPSPGGDKIGLRPITVQLNALRKLGAKIEKEGEFYSVERNDITAKEIILQEFSVTATEIIMMAAVLAKGKTVIKGAAAEPHVEDLGNILLEMGAQIKGQGTHTIEIEGVESLHGYKHAVISDYLEAGTFMVMAALTPGKVVVKNVDFNHLDLFFSKLEDIGVNFDKGENSVTVFYSPFLKPVKVQVLPHPGIATDLLPILAPLLTRAQGKSLIHDPLYGGRFAYVDELRKMGADIEIVDPHRSFIFGPNLLRGITIESSDIRAGAGLIIAALMAEGKTTINNVFQIDRGYEKIEERLQKLGADIKRVSS